MLSIIRQRITKHSLLTMQRLRFLTIKNPNLSEYYFAYGANLSSKRLKRYKLFFEEVSVAKLPGHKLALTLACEYEGKGYAGVEESPHHEVWGTLFKMDRFSLWILDVLEWAWFGSYERKKVSVQQQNTGSIVQSWCYVVKSPVAGLSCSLIYKNLLLEAAKDWQFPENYVKQIVSFDAKDSFVLDHSFSLWNYGKKRKYASTLRWFYKRHDRWREKLCELI